MELYSVEFSTEELSSLRFHITKEKEKAEELLEKSEGDSIIEDCCKHNIAMYSAILAKLEKAEKKL